MMHQNPSGDRQEQLEWPLSLQQMIFGNSHCELRVVHSQTLENRPSLNGGSNQNFTTRRSGEFGLGKGPLLVEN